MSMISPEVYVSSLINMDYDALIEERNELIECIHVFVSAGSHQPPALCKVTPTLLFSVIASIFISRHLCCYLLYNKIP